MTHDQGLLGKAVKKRRDDLGLTQAELATAAGVRTTTISNLETGFTKLERMTKAMQRVEAVLKWQRGSFIAIRDGREPKEVVERPTTTDDLSSRLPVNVASGLEEGEVIDYSFETTTVDGVRRIIVTVKDRDREPLSREERKRLARGDDTTA